VAANDIEPIIAAAVTKMLGIVTRNGPVLSPEEVCSVLKMHVATVVVGGAQLEVSLKGVQETPSIVIEWRRRPAKPRREILFQDEGATELRPIKAKTRVALVRAIAKGQSWLKELASGKIGDVNVIAKRERCSVRSVRMVLGLAFLAPDIVAAALNGNLPRGVGSTMLFNVSPIWSEQRKTLSQ
jgi:hypothetical protein